MFRFLAKHGLVRVIGGRAVPVLVAWDVLVMANRTRQIPIVDRTLRRAGRVTRERIVAAAAGVPMPTRPMRPSRPARPGRPARPANQAEPAGPATPDDPAA